MVDSPRRKHKGHKHNTCSLLKLTKLTTFGAAKLEFSNYGAREVGENYATKMKSSAALRTMVIVRSHIYA